MNHQITYLHACTHTELQTVVVLDPSWAFEEAGAFSFTYLQGMSHWSCKMTTLTALGKQVTSHNYTQSPDVMWIEGVLSAVFKQQAYARKCGIVLWKLVV